MKINGKLLQALKDAGVCCAPASDFSTDLHIFGGSYDLAKPILEAAGVSLQHACGFRAANGSGMWVEVPFALFPEKED